ncbi:MAG: hypothetical protein K0S86_5312 [Geminicoccaceae bacterium]|jgi:hypothetical protein|nr:hypothetical protein [Geminicoccaceae bacterium]
MRSQLDGRAFLTHGTNMWHRLLAEIIALSLTDELTRLQEQIRGFVHWICLEVTYRANPTAKQDRGGEVHIHGVLQA